MTNSLDGALAHLAKGGVVAVATESFFGLLADIANPLAVEALFALKPRGADKGVPIVLPSWTAWQELVVEPIPPLARAFAAACWPGALSVVLPARRTVSPRVALGGSVAVRLPGESPAAELARRFGRPLSATSANLPGAPPAQTSSAVHDSFPEAIARGALLVVPGESPGGAPSTLVTVSEGQYAVVRAGRVSLSTLDAIALTYTASA